MTATMNPSVPNSGMPLGILPILQKLELKETTVGSKAGLDYQDTKEIHLALCYCCCLTREEEAYHTRANLHDFVHQHYGSFRIPIEFDKVECWRERGNSVTNIIVVDEASQKRLFQMYVKVVEAMKLQGIPVPISRLEQMPFHMTLLGFEYDNCKADFDANLNDTISPILPKVYDTLQEINQHFGRVSIVKQDGRHEFVITNDAKFPPKPAKHTRAITPVKQLINVGG